MTDELEKMAHELAGAIGEAILIDHKEFLKTARKEANRLCLDALKTLRSKTRKEDAEIVTKLEIGGCVDYQGVEYARRIKSQISQAILKKDEDEQR